MGNVNLLSHQLYNLIWHCKFKNEINSFFTLRLNHLFAITSNVSLEKYNYQFKSKQLFCFSETIPEKRNMEQRDLERRTGGQSSWLAVVGVTGVTEVIVTSMAHNHDVVSRWPITNHNSLITDHWSPDSIVLCSCSQLVTSLRTIVRCFCSRDRFFYVTLWEKIVYCECERNIFITLSASKIKIIVEKTKVI